MPYGFVKRFLGGAVLLSCAAAAAQLTSPILNQGLNPNSGQQSSCNPTDPSCSSYSNPIRTPSIEPQSQTRGANLNTQQTLDEQLPTQTQQQRVQLQETNLPLDPPTEFQQMVANSTGKMLPIYGAKLFRTLPSTFAPVNQVPVTPDYIIGPNDELLIQSWGQVTMNNRFVVDRSGGIYIPQVGNVHVAGLRFSELQPFLKSQMGRIFRNFDLNVNMGQLRSIQVFVVGQARRPGTWTVSSLSTLVNAIFSTGGPAPQGSLRHIQLKRGNQLIVDFDLYDLILHGDKSKDVPLLQGDVIYIPPVGPQVAIAGSVNTPAIYELKSNDTVSVSVALDMAAGLTSVASGDTARLERVDERRMRSMTEVSLEREGKTVRLRDGDLLEVIALAGQYKDAVTLRGNVANPGRYAWKQGMRVRDLLPNKEALITRDYWLKRSQLGQSSMTYVPTCLPTSPFGIPGLRYGIPVGDEGDDPYWRYSSVRNPGATSLLGLPMTDTNVVRPSVDDRTTNALANNDAAAAGAVGTDGGLDCGRQPSFQGYVPFSPSDMTPGGQQLSSPQVPSQQATSANRVGSANASVGVTTTNASAGQFLPKNDVKLIEPDINWSYAVIERQSKENLTTSLLSFNLGKVVLGGDDSENLALLPGDVVTIFSKADLRVPQQQQTRFVRLEGEFMSSGIYSVKPGETLRQLVQRAGGLSPEAYLYGAEFTRESTRRVQQLQLNEYVDQIALQVSTNAQNSASRAISSTDATALAAQQSQAQNIVANLRNARATGRIVLGLTPDAHDISQLPDLPLEDGDKFVVPRVPSTVSVDGAVYNQNSFIYDPHLRLGDYVQQAGGANRDADKNRAFVIRAGGSVISKQYSSSLRGHGFDSVRLYPGDTVVIPLNLDKGKTLRTVVDIAQIVGQFGIAVAAMNTVLGR
ncbi:MAG: SLBB domain-containing protein [Acidobacteria bacterium]|nr:SLBB domain-containing protein [Acidobacteriota bacterium]